MIIDRSLVVVYIVCLSLHHFHPILSGILRLLDYIPSMAPKKDAKGGKGKSKDGSDAAAGDKGKGKGGGLKPATSINVRHILVRCGERLSFLLTL